MGNCWNCLGGGERDDETPLQNTPPPESSEGQANRGEEPPPPYSSTAPPSRGQAPPLSVSDLKKREEDEVARAKRLSLLHHIPSDIFATSAKGDAECPICMVDLDEGDRIRSLPCMHTFHLDCIDDWLLRSFTCPSCMEPVDAALLSSYANGLADFLADVRLDSLSTSPANAGPSSSCH